MQEKNLTTVQEYFNNIPDLDEVIKKELIGTSMLPFIKGYTSFSCSGHIFLDEIEGLCILTPPVRLMFEYASKDNSVSQDAKDFHKELTSIYINESGYELKCGITPNNPFMKAIRRIPENIEIEPNRLYEYSLFCNESNIITGDALIVKILEDFWTKYSDILSKFLNSSDYQKRTFNHTIKDGRLYSPFAKDPNGINIKESQKGTYSERNINQVH